ncbi:MAG TPA: TIGR02444 family protein [Dongiaceae bacterium]
MPRLDPDAFWEFSLAFYSREPVANACLSLQDRRDADVNILLLCCWLATLEHSIDSGTLRRADAAVANWRRQVILPLRAARQAAADKFPELRKSDRRSIKQAVLSVELECERIAQRKLADAASAYAENAATDTVRSRALRMMGDYLALLDGTPESQDHEDLREILGQL